MQVVDSQGSNYWRFRKLDDQKKDWLSSGSWLDGYMNSINHPHRDLIIEEIEKLQPLNDLTEIGCSCGPNIYRIKRAFPWMILSGIDINSNAIEKAQKDLFSFASFSLVDMRDMGVIGNSEIVLLDAVLMYTTPQEIQNISIQIANRADKAIIVVDWDDENIEGVIKNGHWARNYIKLFEPYGFKGTKRKLTEQEWPNSKGWLEHGHIYTLVRQ